MARIALLLVLAVAGYSQDSKPACNKHTSGQFWPPDANTDSKVARAYSRCGALELCTLNGGWRYKWVAVSVNVRQFSADKEKAIAACLQAVPVETAATPSTGQGN